ncbi:DUF2267 domain-containing protein [Streptomyces sp. XD-27]|uniref:DUF2267 domain-containing protein n=1 Tax=Streptomyces sp. XD-27 TaxID=3062779 RepID=UPI0026F42641|nr:DUF2267 domain-containing protein [Streptomyces sp. XD-27]WKX73776.1 DUF2267 domain-containing protein [Streptomyces sp. XD-27]
MITHERLIAEAADEVRVTRGADAGHVARIVLAELALHLEIPQRRLLQRALPAADRDAAYATVPRSTGGAAELVREVGRHLELQPERARHLTRRVLSAIADSDPDLVAALRPHLSPDIDDLFAAP